MWIRRLAFVILCLNGILCLVAIIAILFGFGY
jgi:hypothetical protein